MDAYVLPAVKAIIRRAANNEKYLAVERFACRDRGAKLLDIGRGSEDLLRRLGGYDGLKLYGVTLGEPKGQLSHARPEELPYQDEFFDTVMTADTLDQWEDIPAGLGEVRRVLKTGGSFVCAFSEPDPYELRRCARQTGFTEVRVKIIEPERSWLLLCRK